MSTEPANVGAHTLVIEQRQVLLAVCDAATVITNEHGRHTLRKVVGIYIARRRKDIGLGMGMWIDKAGHNGQAGGVYHGVGSGVGARVHGRNPIIDDTNAKDTRFGQRAIINRAVDDQ